VASQAPRTMTLVVDTHLYGVIVVTPGPRITPRRPFCFPIGIPTFLTNYPLSLAFPRTSGSTFTMTATSEGVKGSCGPANRYKGASGEYYAQGRVASVGEPPGNSVIGNVYPCLV
jgi:hypothetical protein